MKCYHFCHSVQLLNLSILRMNVHRIPFVINLSASLNLKWLANTMCHRCSVKKGLPLFIAMLILSLHWYTVAWTHLEGRLPTLVFMLCHPHTQRDGRNEWVIEWERKGKDQVWGANCHLANEHYFREAISKYNVKLWYKVLTLTVHCEKLILSF